MQVIPNGLMFDGHDTPRAELLDQARTWLAGQGMHEIDAEDQLTPRPGLMVRAWVADHGDDDEHDHSGCDDWHFVQEGHPGARPVVVLHLAGPEHQA